MLPCTSSSFRNIARFCWVLVLLAGCSSSSEGPASQPGADAGPGETPDAGASSDGGGDATLPPNTGCSPTGAFGSIEPVSELGAQEGGDPWVSGDGKTLLLAGSAPNFRSQLLVATRADGRAPFGALAPLAASKFAGDEYRPSFSPDGLTLYVTRGSAILSAKRASLTMPFGDFAPLALQPPATSTAVDVPRQAGDSLYFSVYGADRRWSVYRRDLVGNATSPVFQSIGRVGGIAVTADEKVLYMALEGDKGWEVYRTARSGKTTAFATPVKVPELSGPHPADQGFGITGVTGDDCEVFGYVLSLQGKMQAHRARRAR